MTPHRSTGTGSRPTAQGSPPARPARSHRGLMIEGGTPRLAAGVVPRAGWSAIGQGRRVFALDRRGTRPVDDSSPMSAMVSTVSEVRTCPGGSLRPGLSSRSPGRTPRIRTTAPLLPLSREPSCPTAPGCRWPTRARTPRRGREQALGSRGRPPPSPAGERESRRSPRRSV